MCENVNRERRIAAAILSDLVTFAAIKDIFKCLYFPFDNLIIDENGRITE